MGTYEAQISKKLDSTPVLNGAEAYSNALFSVNQRKENSVHQLMQEKANKHGVGTKIAQLQQKSDIFKPEIIQLAKGDPPIINAQGKKHILIGTTHGVAGKDKSDMVPEDMRQNAAVILEYPSLAQTGRDHFSDHEIGTVSDKTQASLAQVARDSPADHNLTVVGADGRKAFEGDNIHALSLRNKQAIYNYDVPSMALLPKNMFHVMGEKYIDRCLGFVGGNVDFIANKLNNYVHYYDGTGLAHVLRSTYNRMHTISNRLPKDRRLSIKRKVMAKLDSDLDSALMDYQSQKKGYKEGNILASLIEATNTDFFNALNDSLANLLLYTEVLVNSSPNIIVAYGAEHLAALQQLLNETWAVRRRKRKKRKR